MDIVEKKLNYRDSNDRESNYMDSNEGTKILLVGKDDPSKDTIVLLAFYSNSGLYDNEVVYLKADAL
jgi:hypothetical protein